MPSAYGSISRPSDVIADARREADQIREVRRFRKRALGRQDASMATSRRLDYGRESASLKILARARSSTGQSIGLRIRGLGVRLPSGAPIKSMGYALPMIVAGRFMPYFMPYR